MSLQRYELCVVDEIRATLAETDEEQIRALVQAILDANRIFVGGAGRSLAASAGVEALTGKQEDNTCLIRIARFGRTSRRLPEFLR